MLDEEDLTASAEQQQQTILNELELILSTVKQIDKNILDCIDVLKSTGNGVHTGDINERLDFNGILRKGTESVRDILTQLESI